MFENKQYLKFIEKSKKEKLDIALTIVTNTQGSTFSKAGNKMLVNSRYEFIGVLGSDLLQKKIFKNSKEALNSNQIITFNSIPKNESSGHGESIYKTIPFYFDNNYENIGEYLSKNFSLLIFGSGAHVTALILMANLMGWETTVLDLNIKKEFVIDADNLIELRTLEDIFLLDLSIYDASVILSHSPITDDTYLKALLKTNIQYIGIMGNKKSAQNKKEKFCLENDKRFFAPIGFDIGSYTPESIALSICAQIEARKNGKI